MPAFIIVFKDNASGDQKQQFKDNVTSSGGQIKSDYEMINGFSAEVPDSLVAQLQCDDIVSYMEPDQIVTTQ